MNKHLFIFIFLLLALNASAQSDFKIRGYYGVSGSSVARKVMFEGAGAVEMNQTQELGLILSKEFGTKFTLNAGVGYTYGKVDFFPPCPTCFMPHILWGHEPKFRMLSVPIYGEYSLGKIFYLAAGPLLDFQQSEGNNFSDQSGLGYLAGIGARASVGNFVFSLFPNYKRHGVAPFERQEGYEFIFQELGVQIGLGYSF